jgi:hypothetical protein
LAEGESWDDLRVDTPPTFSLGAELDRLDQEQVDAAIAASRAEFQESFLPATSQPTASSSHMRSSTPPPPPTLQASQFQEPSDPSLVFFAGVPVTKVLANSKNKPKITTQMVPTWMRDLDDRTNQPQVIVGASRRGQVDLEMIHKFRIIWWAKVCPLCLIFC